MADGDVLMDAYLPLRAGATVPADYRYLVYSMLKHECRPDLTARGWQLLPIHGRLRGDLLHFDRRDGLHCLRVRLPIADLGYLRKIEGKPVRVSHHLLIVDEVVVRELRPAPVLHSELVVITSDDDDRGVRGEEYGMHVGKRIGAMLGRIDVGIQIGQRSRLHIAGNRIFGHPVTVRGLTSEESMRLQREGIGESRGMGCGVFEPSGDGMDVEQRAAWGL